MGGGAIFGRWLVASGFWPVAGGRWCGEGWVGVTYVLGKWDGGSAGAERGAPPSNSPQARAPPPGPGLGPAPQQGRPKHRRRRRRQQMCGNVSSASARGPWMWIDHRHRHGRHLWRAAAATLLRPRPHHAPRHRSHAPSRCEALPAMIRAATNWTNWTNWRDDVVASLRTETRNSTEQTEATLHGPVVSPRSGVNPRSRALSYNGPGARAQSQPRRGAVEQLSKWLSNSQRKLGKPA